MAALTFSYSKWDDVDCSSSDDECAAPRAPVPHTVGSEAHGAAWGSACASQAEAYGWLADCFRLRATRDGRYGENAAPLVVGREFLVFSCLAVQGDCLPKPWVWAHFLAVAAKRVARALGEDEARAQWGAGDGGPLARLTGGRAATATAARVYGSASGAPVAPCEAAALDAYEGGRVDGALLSGDDPDGLLAAVGGAEVWRAFHAALAAAAAPGTSGATDRDGGPPAKGAFTKAATTPVATAPHTYAA